MVEGRLWSKAGLANPLVGIPLREPYPPVGIPLRDTRHMHPEGCH